MTTNYRWVGPQATIDKVKMPDGILVTVLDSFRAEEVTPFQLSVVVTGEGELFIDHATMVSHKDIHRTGFVRYNSATNKWDEFPFTREGESFRLKIKTTGIYAMTLNPLAESAYVEEAVSTFPEWYAGRSDKKSNLRRLANVPAALLNDASEDMKKILADTRLLSIPLGTPSSTVRYAVAELGEIDGLKVGEMRQGVYHELKAADDVEDFFYDPTSERYLIDTRRAVIHRMHEEGELVVEGTLSGRQLTRAVTGVRTDLFNAFDEIGLQFGLARIKGESNERYRDRMLTLFSHPGNATKQGVEREIARRVGDFVRVEWGDDRIGLLVSNPEGHTFAMNDVKVDGEDVLVFPQADGGFLIRPTNLGKKRDVVYYKKAETFMLGKDGALEDGTMSDRYKELYAIWAEEAPVLYGGVKYDRQEWDMVSDEGLVEWMPRTDSTMERWD